jgi:AraC family transcriptional regulator
MRQIDIVAQTSKHLVSLVLRGTVNLEQCQIGQVYQRKMQAGDVIVIRSGERTLWRHDREADVLMLWLTPSLLTKIFRAVKATDLARIQLVSNFGTRDTVIENVLLQLVEELKGEGFASRVYVQSLVNQLAVHLLRYYSATRDAVDDSLRKLPRHKLHRVTDYIEENLRQGLTVEKIAKTLPMSTCYFARLFKQTTGLAPHRYVIERRIEQAKYLLRETELPLMEIAHQVGFSTQSHFSEVFHRFTSVAPAVYRKRAQSQFAH